MKMARAVTLCAGMAAFEATFISCAQSPAVTAPGAQVMLSSGGLHRASTEGLVQGEMIREIDDPHTGERWLLVPNGESPGGPGRLVLAAADQDSFGGAAPRAAKRTEDPRLGAVIRAGDRLVVEEHTRLVDAALEARALGPAAVGSSLDARLAMGGRVVRVVALGPGRAALQPENGARP